MNGKDRIKQLLKEKRFKQALEMPFVEKEEDNLKAALFGNTDNKIENVALAGLTFGDLLYDIMSVNPQVVQAADFSRAEDIDNVFKFGFFSDRLSDLSDASFNGAFSNLKGYVAEQFVASKLVEQGHQVVLPEHPNQAGFDLIVDGQEFQIKCLASTDGIAEHFDQFPDIPVIANAELAEEIAESGEDWIDNVFFLEGFDLDTVSEITSGSIEAGQEILDYEIPLFTAIISSVKNIHSWWRSDVSMVDALANIAADVTCKGTLGVLGGFAGKGVGLLIFGPAGGVIFGGVIAVVAASQSHNFISFLKETRASKLFNERLVKASNDLLNAVSSGLDKKIEIIKKKKASLKGLKEIVEYMNNRFEDDLRYFQERRNEVFSLMKGSPGSAVEYAITSIDVARRSKVHQALLQQEYTNLLNIFSTLQSSTKSWFTK